MVLTSVGYLFKLFILLSTVSCVTCFVPHSSRPTGNLPSKVKNPNSLTTVIEQYAGSEEVNDFVLIEEAKDEDVLEGGINVQYAKLTKEHYLTMALVQAGTIATVADVVTQKMEGLPDIDLAHVLAISSVAAVFSGAFNAFWLRLIEQAFPGKAPNYVLTKAIISTLLLGGAINTAYIIGIPLLESTVFAQDGLAHLPPFDPKILLAGWSKEEFITITKIECVMFLPYHLLAFNLVPPQLRPLTQAAMAGTFNVMVSAVTLGFFDTWINHAQHLIGLR